MNVTLVMFKVDGTRRDFPIRKNSVVIGRKSNCSLRIPLPEISRQHCEVSVTDDGIVLKDLGSSNGTYHNSIRVQEAELTAGDEIMMGPVVFTVVVDGKPSDIKPARTMLDPDRAEESHDTMLPEQGEAVEIADLQLDGDLDLSRELDDELAASEGLATPSIDEPPMLGLDDSDLEGFGFESSDLESSDVQDVGLKGVDVQEANLDDSDLLGDDFLKMPSASAGKVRPVRPSEPLVKADSVDDGDDELDLDALFGEADEAEQKKKDTSSLENDGSSIFEFDFDDLDEI